MSRLSNRGVPSVLGTIGEDLPVTASEQLDSVLRIASVRSWVLLALVFSTLGAFCVFGWFYRAPIKVEGRGIILAKGSAKGELLRQVTAPAAGRLKRLLVKIGAEVRAGDVLGEIEQGDLRDQITESEQELERLIGENEELRRLDQAEGASRTESSARVGRALKRNLDLDARRLGTSRKIAESDQGLSVKGMLSKIEALKSLEDADELESEIGRLESRIETVKYEQMRDDFVRRRESLKRQLAIQAARAKRDLLRERHVRDTCIVSPYMGRVVDLMITPHGLVEKGAPAALLRPTVSTSHSFETVAFVPAGMGKRIRVGDDAEISPDTARRHEHGFIRGKVTSASEIPATELAMLAELKHKALVGSFVDRYSGQVLLCVHIALPEGSQLPGDSTNALTWSSRSGTQQPISSGTLCGVDVVVERRRAISLVFPWLKQIVGYN